MTNKNIIKDGKKVIDIEIQGIKKLYKTIDNNFEKAVKKLSKINGRVIITGVGKSGHIAARSCRAKWNIKVLSLLSSLIKFGASYFLSIN